jgi:hypothetical protein
VRDEPLALAKMARRSPRATPPIAGLDRLGRDAHFLRGPPRAGVESVAADVPGADIMTVGIMAVVARHEREQVGACTRVAPAATGARGARLGNPGKLVSGRSAGRGARQLGEDHRGRALRRRPGGARA